ncbi:hypothetical protein KSC_022630 [Ktedonobacter sp. SOSP1-52]|nr:hypothetical protein KSC_022630 [Ktedonobacter sp. SOSP1-52]
MTDKWPPVITMLARRLNLPKVLHVLHVLIVSEKERRGNHVVLRSPVPTGGYACIYS